MHKNSHLILIYVYRVIVVGCYGSTHTPSNRSGVLLVYTYWENQNCTWPYVLVEVNQNNHAIVQKSLENVKHTYDTVTEMAGNSCFYTHR